MWAAGHDPPPSRAHYWRCTRRRYRQCDWERPRLGQEVPCRLWRERPRSFRHSLSRGRGRVLAARGPAGVTARGCRVPAPRSADLYFALPCPSSTPSRPRPASSKQSAGLATLLYHHWPFSPSHQLGHCNLLIACQLPCAPLTLLYKFTVGAKLFPRSPWYVALKNTHLGWNCAQVPISVYLYGAPFPLGEIPRHSNSPVAPTHQKNNRCSTSFHLTRAW